MFDYPRVVADTSRVGTEITKLLVLIDQQLHNFCVTANLNRIALAWKQKSVLYSFLCTLDEASLYLPSCLVFH